MTEREHVGASSIQAAPSAASYPARIDHERLSDAVVPEAYIETVRTVIERYGECGQR